MTDYTEEEIQELISQLPLERVVKITPKMSQIEAQNAYLACFMDRDTTKVVKAEQMAFIAEERANLRVALRETTDENERKKIQEKLESLANQLKG